MNKIAIITLISSFTSIAAFSAPCPSSTGISCTVSNSGYSQCIEPTASFPADTFQTQCQASGGTFSNSTCSSANRVGSCLIGQQSVIMRLYAPIPAQYVEMICTQSQGTVCQ